MSASLHMVAKTVAINTAAGGTLAVFTPDADKKFVVTKWFLMPSGAVTTTWKSAATAISGALPLQANIAYQDGSGDEAVLIGNAKGEALQLTFGGAVQTDGYVVVAQLEEYKV